MIVGDFVHLTMFGTLECDQWAQVTSTTITLDSDYHADIDMLRPLDKRLFDMLGHEARGWLLESHDEWTVHDRPSDEVWARHVAHLLAGTDK